MSDFPPLRDGETLLWEGQPDTSLHFGIETMGTGIFAAALTLACLGMGTVINRSVDGMFWPIFGPGVLIAAVIVLALPLRDAARRKRIRYRLTDQRALILGRAREQTTECRRDGYPIPPPDALRLDDSALGSVYFATTPTRQSRHRPYDPVGFEHIAEASAVYAMMKTLSEKVHA